MSSANPPPIVQTDFLLVGGGIAAVTAAQTLRDEGAEGSILLLCAEAQYPYNRPPLTKEIATSKSQAEQHLLATPEYYRENKIDVRLGSAARTIDPSSHTVIDQTGGAYRYGKLLIATGAAPCQLPIPGADLDGVFTFRCAADATALKRWISTNPGPVAIIGTSFIAMELATSLNRMGLKVTLIDHAEAAFPKIHSPTLSAYFLERCENYGIKILLGETVAQFCGSGQVSGVQTVTGQTLSCETIILAIGATPQTDFLEHSGIKIDAGVLVDEFLQTNAPDIFAAGDVAAYLDRYGKRQRAEHWENARRQGRTAAKNMLDQRVPYGDVPHYFCDFLDLSFTFLGTSEDADVRIGRGTLQTKSFAEFYIRNDRIIGFFSTGRPPNETRVAETLIRDRVDIHAAVAQLADPAAGIEPLARETVLILQGGGALGVAAMEVVHPRLGWEVVVTTLATPVPEPRMDIHKNARTTPHSRMLMMQRLASGWTVAAVAEAQGVTIKTVGKWHDRFAAAGKAGLADRSSRPHRSPTRLSEQDEDAIVGLRRQRMTGPAIARQLGRPPSTVGVVLRRHGLGRLTALDPKPPIRRYQRERPGELIHIDTKKLGRIDGIGHRITGHHTGMVKNRGIGWEHLHVAIDDASRLAYTELLSDERRDSATGFLSRALAWFARHGVTVERVMTDNGSAYRSHDFRRAIDAAGLRHIRTRPYTPRTNGKAERFIQSSLREWAYAQPFDSSAARGAAMQTWIDTYNHSRPHSALNGKTPISQIARDNLLGNDS